MVFGLLIGALLLGLLAIVGAVDPAETRRLDALARLADQNRDQAEDEMIKLRRTG